MTAAEMNPETELYRLTDLMPASGRMWVQLEAQSRPIVLQMAFPRPWQQSRSLKLNLDLWGQLEQPQRDLLLLRSVNWLLGVQWLKVGWPQGLVISGVVSAAYELLWLQTAGALTAAGVAVFGAVQLWRNSRSPGYEQAIDEEAIDLAQRRGYSETEAVRHLSEAIAAVASLEARELSLTETLRLQVLRSRLGLPLRSS